MTRLHITIGRRHTSGQRIAGVATTFVLLLAPPTYNEYVLGGHWAVHLMCAVFSFMIAAALLKAVGDTTQRFDTPEEAAEWVLSRKWEVGG